MGVGGVGEPGLGEGCKEGVGGLCGRGWRADETATVVAEGDVPQAVIKSVVLLSARPKNLSEFSRTNLVMSVDMGVRSGLGKHASLHETRLDLPPAVVRPRLPQVHPRRRTRFRVPRRRKTKQSRHLLAPARGSPPRTGNRDMGAHTDSKGGSHRGISHP